ncbi:MAG: hypothetical protein Harvfovirus14_26 [Harvfovirus sp.]|uniref:Uncharacterized protein n=1 Tax=Harvfovirus sp. TaxID=2487768 RepID=A0A3G5A1G3_9VIRU|nr:MAG: hypothetical protein Harvfovirus14_26 [Harvfovirus sp.]
MELPFIEASKQYDQLIRCVYTCARNTKNKYFADKEWSRTQIYVEMPEYYVIEKRWFITNGEFFYVISTYWKDLQEQKYLETLEQLSPMIYPEKFDCDENFLNIDDDDNDNQFEYNETYEEFIEENWKFTPAVTVKLTSNELQKLFAPIFDNGNSPRLMSIAPAIQRASDLYNHLIKQLLPLINLEKWLNLIVISYVYYEPYKN